MLPRQKLLFVRSISLCKVTTVIGNMPKPKSENDEDSSGQNEGDGGRIEESKPKSRKKRSVYDAPAYTDANGNPAEEFR